MSTEATRKKNRAANAKYRTRLRQEVIVLLGGKCSCGIIDPRVLQIDHRFGGGTRESKSIGSAGIVRKALREPTSYQLLCANCNWIKRNERGEVRPRIDS